MPLRVLHRAVVAPSEDGAIAKHAAATRDEAGCLEAEVFRSLDDPEIVAFIQLWEDEYAFSEHSAQLKASDPDLFALFAQPAARANGRFGTEFYNRTPFARDENQLWAPTPVPEQRSAISWPARGSVRIIIQGGVSRAEGGGEATPNPGQAANAAETRREPGCVQFGWHQNIEAASHTLLLELWQDQKLYDAHWRLRQKTTPPRPAAQGGGQGGQGGGGQRPRGSMSMEFYRHQPFVQLYDRWLPADPMDWSDTILWPN